jgi:hypothetical protein
MIEQDLNALKQKIDNGEEILTIKHVYDLSEEEMRKLLDLCEGTYENQ